VSQFSVLRPHLILSPEVFSGLIPKHQSFEKAGFPTVCLLPVLICISASDHFEVLESEYSISSFLAACCDKETSKSGIVRLSKFFTASRFHFCFLQSDQNLLQAVLLLLICISVQSLWLVWFRKPFPFLF
jgi:hypothetical protein